MTKCKKAFLLDIPLYKQQIIFLFHLSDKEIEQKVQKIVPMFKDLEKRQTFMEPLITGIGNTCARTVQYSSGAICVRFYDIMDIKSVEGFACLMHELVHVCSFIFDRIGMSHNRDTDEAYAYLFGHISERVLLEL